MSKPTLHYIAEEELELFEGKGVDGPGWYWIDDNHRAVDGPFATKKDAEKANDEAA